MFEFLRNTVFAAIEILRPEQKPENYWIDFLITWQTLVAASLAGVPAIVGAYLLWRQIDLQRKELERARRKEEMGARIQMLPALSSLSRYYKDCIVLVVDSSPAIPEVPQQPVSVLMLSAPTLDEKLFKHIQQLIADLQIFSARMSSSSGPISSDLREIATADLGRLHSATDALYPYARFSTDSVELPASTRAALNEAIRNLLTTAGRTLDHEDKELIESSLDTRFPRKTSTTVPVLEP